MSETLDAIFQKFGIPVEETAFPSPPDGDFAVWGQSIRTEGGDYTAFPKSCSVILEYYEPSDLGGTKTRDHIMDVLDEAVEAGEIEPWSAEPRVWLEDVRLYMTTFNFDYYWRE